jgi:hypothetical protein
MWVMWNLNSVHLEPVLVLVQDRCMVCAKGTIGLEIIFDAPDGTLGHEAQVDARFCPFGDSANFDARYLHRLHRTYHRLRNNFGHTRLYS